MPSGVLPRVGAGVEQCLDVRSRAPPPDRPQQGRAPIGRRRAEGRLVRVASVRQQKPQRVELSKSNTRYIALLPAMRAPASSSRRVHATFSSE